MINWDVCFVAAFTLADRNANTVYSPNFAYNFNEIINELTLSLHYIIFSRIDSFSLEASDSNERLFMIVEGGICGGGAY